MEGKSQVFSLVVKAALCNQAQGRFFSVLAIHDWLTI